jgi:hypothetical protein
MSIFCGGRFKVVKPVKKLIVEGLDLGMRQLRNAVILDGAMCTGENHGGCQKTCFLLWKEKWLKRQEGILVETLGIDAPPLNSDSPSSTALGSNIYQCQATSLVRATSPLPIWDARRYIWDITSGTYGPLERVSHLLKSCIRRLYRIFDKTQRRSIRGGLKKTPVAALNLQPGDIVEVKSKEEILKTLDSWGKNRGLVFTAEMVRYCGNRFTVLKKLDKMINEATGELKVLANTVLLEGGTCDGKSHGGCQRMCQTYWRDIWLRKIP